MAVKFRDYYEVLGVPRTASADDIRRAYRKLARQHHPDLKPPAERAAAAERFKEINEANEVLSDPEKRKKYDALGHNWKQGQEFTPPPGWGGFGGAGAPGDGGQWAEVDLGDFSDFFASIFGGAPPGAGPRGRGRGARGRGADVRFPGSDVEAELPITVEEMLRGGKRRIGLDGGRTLDVDIPAGVRDGGVLRLAGQGGPGIAGGPAGDLFLRLRAEENGRFRPNGDDLEMDLALWPWQAALGAEIQTPTPEGVVKLKIPPGTPAGRRLRLRGRGLLLSGGERGERGDLYVTIRITVSESPNEQEREAYEALKRASAAPPDRPAE